MTQIDRNDILRKIDAFIKHAREKALSKTQFASMRKINGEICQAKGAFIKDTKYRFQFFIDYDNCFKYNLNEYENQEIIVILA